MRIRNLLIPLALLLAACGGSAAPSSQSGSQAATNQAPTGAATSAAASPGAETLQGVRAAASKEGRLLWYDTITQEQGEQVLKQFQQAFPEIKDVKYVEVTSGNRVAKITQESRAGGPTTDVDFENAATTAGFYKDGLVLDGDWKGMGIEGPAQMTPTSYMVAVTAAFRGTLYNTNHVKDVDAPKTYEDLIDPKWTGRIGLWSRAAAFTGLWQTWGEDKLVNYVHSLAKLKPRLYDSNFTIAQAIGAGEVDVSYTDYHTTLPTVQKGAPVKWVTIDPVPLDPLYGYVLKAGSNHNAGKLFLYWLTTPDGAKAYEAQAGRGNPFVQGSDTQKQLAGHTTSSVDLNTMLQQADHFNQLEKQFANILKSGS